MGSFRIISICTNSDYETIGHNSLRLFSVISVPTGTDWLFLATTSVYPSWFQ